MAVWSQSLYVIVPLVLLICGHWTLLLQGVIMKAEFVPGQGCVITETNATILRGTFIYAMALDFIVLCLTGFKLVMNARVGTGGRSRLMQLIFNDGLIYFFITLVPRPHLCAEANPHFFHQIYCELNRCRLPHTGPQPDHGNCIRRSRRNYQHDHGFTRGASPV